MYDDAPFLILSSISAFTVIASFVALFWAAIQDGNDERNFRAG